jgi:mono/diheme cytochrome c family protein
MKVVSSALALSVLWSGVAAAQPTGTADVATDQALVNRYCAGCHNDRRASGGFSWSAIDLADPAQNAAASEKVIRKLRAGLMPPPGMSRPDAMSTRALVTAIETAVDRRAAARPHAGAPELHRLNRTEYRNAIRDLLALDVDVSSMLPPDEMGRGFDNMADALTITPSLVQGYVRAASRISREAVGDRRASPAETMYRVPKVVNQMRHVDGAPLGTRGGTVVTHNFPADGEYTFKLQLYYDYLETLFGQSLPPNLQGQEIEISVDGARVAIFKIDPNIPETKNIMVTPRVTIAAGPHRVAAAFISKFDGPTEDLFRQVEKSMVDISAGIPGVVALPHLLSMTVAGPFAVAGVSETPSRRRIFSCTPTSQNDELSCAQAIISRLARQAFRRPVTDAETEFLFGYYKEGRRDDGFEGGIQRAVQAMIASPNFVFRLERAPASVAPGTNYRITDLELASRLSFFLWSSVPDEPLVRLAAAGKLKEPTVLEREVRRMLADRRAVALADNFAYQWLRLQTLKEVDPDGGLFPNFTRNLAQSLTRETKLLFEHIMRADRSIVELLTADYTHVDEVLAKHYGIPNVQGSTFRRVPVADPNRQGLLGHSSVLTLTSLANRTSPVMRGKYVLEVLLGVSPPPAPADVPPLMENIDNQKAVPVRERLEQHRRSPACSACHAMMDPIGLSLENFDGIGLWRSTDAGAPVDPSGLLYDGTKLDGPVSLRAAILDRADAFVTSFSENLLAYGLGRLIDYRDMPVVRAIQREAALDGNRFSAFVLGVVKSVPFQMREAETPVTTAGVR